MRHDRHSPLRKETPLLLHTATLFLLLTPPQQPSLHDTASSHPHHPDKCTCFELERAMNCAWKSGWRSINLANWELRAVTRDCSMSWQCRGVRYSSTSTAVACSMLRRLRTPGGISASASTSICTTTSQSVGQSTILHLFQPPRAHQMSDS